MSAQKSVDRILLSRARWASPVLPLLCALTLSACGTNGAASLDAASTPSSQATSAAPHSTAPSTPADEQKPSATTPQTTSPSPSQPTQTADSPTPTPLAHANYIADPIPTSCEFGIIIDDKLQGQGIGHQLMTQLIAHAKTPRHTLMRAEILSDNHPMQKLALKLGFTLNKHPHDNGLVEAKLHLM